MREGRARVASVPGALPVLDAAALLRATEPWETALVAGGNIPEGPPRLPRI
jgi:hypothetical protein